MADIRKRTGSKGTTYQVRYASKGAEGGYAYATFDTLKEARDFPRKRRDQRRSQLAATRTSRPSRMPPTNGWASARRKASTDASLSASIRMQNYEYRISFIKGYEWPKPIHELAPPDVVAFRSWLLEEGTSRVVASKVLSTLHSVLKEMTIRGVLHQNVAQGICVRADSRYEEPVRIPSKQEIIALLGAADEACNLAAMRASSEHGFAIARSFTWQSIPGCDHRSISRSAGQHCARMACSSTAPLTAVEQKSQ